MKENNVIQTFGRRRGRALTLDQQELIEKLLPNLMLDIDKIGGLSKACLEIGFGNGQHIAARAKESPESYYIGCEPYINGVASLLKLIELDNINNIGIYMDDARDILNQIADNFLDKIYILFPDPWPKAKHHKRRLINQQTLELLSSKLKQDGQLVIATDHLDYASWIFEHLMNQPYFLVEKDFSKYQKEPENWVKTKYQQKAESLGIVPYFFELYKKP